MTLAFNWVISIIDATFDWLTSWEYGGIPFLYYLVALALTGIVLRYVL